MHRTSLKIDQWIAIGQDIRISPTDLDARGARFIAKGRVLGGPNDGATFEKTLEMAIGSSVNLNPHVVLTLVSVRDGVARLDVFVPANVLVQSE